MCGVGCVAREPATFSVGWGGRGRSSLLLGRPFADVVVVDRLVAVGEGSNCVFREPCRFPCGLEGDV